MSYTAFISYRRSDGTSTANWLRGALQSYRLPRSLRNRHDSCISIFHDTAYERGAHDFYEMTIKSALLASRHLIVLATPNADNLIIVRAVGTDEDEDSAPPPEIISVERRTIGNLEWMVGIHRGALLQGFESQYYVTIARDVAIAVTYSFRIGSSDEIADIGERIAESLATVL